MRPRFPRRRFLHHSDRVVRAATRWGRVEWVLSRALYRVIRINLAQVAVADRASALALKVRQISPFAETGFTAAWHGGNVVVAMWDRAAVAAAQQGVGVDAPDAVLPETFLRPPASGTRFSQALDGFEAQVWRNGALVASHYFPAAPDASAWQLFLREHGEPLSGLPQDVKVPLAADAWARLSPAGTGSFTLPKESLIYSLVGAALCVPTVWYSVAWAKLQLAVKERQAALAQLTAAALPQQQKRGEALAAADDARRIYGLDKFPAPAEVMDWVAPIVVRDGGKLAEWQYNPGRVRFVMQTESATQTASSLVEAIERQGRFRNARAVPSAAGLPRGFTVDADVLARGEATTKIALAPVGTVPPAGPPGPPAASPLTSPGVPTPSESALLPALGQPSTKSAPLLAPPASAPTPAAQQAPNLPPPPLPPGAGPTAVPPAVADLLKRMEADRALPSRATAETVSTPAPNPAKAP